MTAPNASSALTRNPPKNEDPSLASTFDKLNITSPKTSLVKTSPPSPLSPEEDIDTSAFDLSHLDLLSRAKSWNGISQTKLLRLFSDITEAFEVWHQDERANFSSPNALDINSAIEEILKSENVDRITRAQGNMMLAELSEDPMRCGRYREDVRMLVELVETAVRENGLLRPPRLSEVHGTLWIWEKQESRE